MSVVILTCEQEDLVKNAALKCGFKDFDITAKVGSLKGDNYLGVINAVTVREEEDGKVLHFILKSAHTNDVFRKAAPIAAVYKREAFLYDTVISRFLKYQDEATISQPFSGVAKLYGYNLEEKSESILMQNLKESGYKLWNRMEPMNEEHIILVFTEYARFHAISLALKQKHTEEFNELTKPIDSDVFENVGGSKEQMDNFISTSFKTVFTVVEGNSKVIAALEKLHSNIGKLFEQSKSEKSNTPVVLHGDCWCNNMLFKYKENQTTPAKVCFIDWQLSKVGSPVQDLTYFFSVCGSKQTYPNLIRYLTIYHKVLSENLQEFGCNPEEVLSFEALMNQWSKYAWFGVFMGMMVFKFMLSHTDEVPDISEGATSESELVKKMTEYEFAKSSEYQTRLCDLVEFMSDNNYI